MPPGGSIFQRAFAELYMIIVMPRNTQLRYLGDTMSLRRRAMNPVRADLNDP
jgi:hypothetical protein